MGGGEIGVWNFNHLAFWVAAALPGLASLLMGNWVMAKKLRPQSWSKFAVFGICCSLSLSGLSTLVVLLLAVVLIRYNSRRNPESSSVAHNNILEVIWIAIPVIILILIITPSMRLLYGQLQLPDGKSKIADKVVPAVTLTVKATGSQWY